MTSLQLSKLAMYIAVRVFLAEFLNSTLATSAPPVLTAKAAALIAYIDRIIELNTAQNQSVDANLADRDQSLAATAAVALVVAGRVFSYALANNLHAVASEVDLTRTDFSRLRQVERMPLAQRVHDTALAHIAQLADYGITPVSLADFQKQINDTTGVVNDASAMVDGKTVATKELVLAFAKADRLLREIDPLLLELRESNTEFYALYRKARDVSSPGARGAETPETGTTAPATPPAQTPAV